MLKQFGMIAFYIMDGLLYLIFDYIHLPIHNQQHNSAKYGMSSPGVALYLDQELLALILHGYHHHVGLVDQVRGRSEHSGRLPLLEK